MIEKLKKLIVKIISYSLPLRDNHINLIFWVSAGLIGIIGIILRLKQYLANRSLWLDESALAINIKEKGFHELLQPLEFNQAAPVGFLYLEKLSSIIGGVNEFSLRFFPLLSGLLILPVSFLLYKKLMGKTAALIGLWLIAISWPLIYYSSEVKQYSFDVLATVSLIYSYLVYSDFNNRKKAFIVLGTIGIIWVWLSNISIIILVSIAIIESIQIFRLKDRTRLLYFSGIVLLWAVSFSIYFILFIYQHPSANAMENYWAAFFAPINSLHDFTNWFKDEIFNLFSSFLWYGPHANKVILALGFGIALSIFQRKSLLIYIVPILITIVLSVLKKYPFHDRLILFLLPFFFGFIAYGISIPFKIAEKKTIKYLFIIILFIYLNKYTHNWAKNFYENPPMREHIRPVFEEMTQYIKKTDYIYVYIGAHKSFRFYQDQYFNDHQNVIYSSWPDSNFEKFKKQFNSIKGRVWIPLSHLTPVSGIEYIEEWVNNNPDLVIKKIESSSGWNSIANAKSYLIERK